MKKLAWILIANSSLAKIYRIDQRDVLVEIEEFQHPESRLHNRDLVSDRPGRDFESNMSGTRHSLETRHTPKQNEAILFAKEISRYLSAARNNNEFSDLFIVSSPNMLGLLRNEFDTPLAKCVIAELDRDLTQMSSEDLVKHLPFLYSSRPLSI